MYSIIVAFIIVAIIAALIVIDSRSKNKNKSLKVDNTAPSIDPLSDVKDHGDTNTSAQSFFRKYKPAIIGILILAAFISIPVGIKISEKLNDPEYLIEGTWKCEDIVFTFDDGNFVFYIGESRIRCGSYDITVYDDSGSDDFPDIRIDLEYEIDDKYEEFLIRKLDDTVLILENRETAKGFALCKVEN